LITLTQSFPTFLPIGGILAHANVYSSEHSRSWQRTEITSALPTAGQKSPPYVKGSIF
jgi:hypothetical protein